MAAVWNVLTWFCKAFADRIRGSRSYDDKTSTSDGVKIVAVVAGDQIRSRLASICRAHRWDVHFSDTCEGAAETGIRLKVPVILYDRDVPGTEWREAVQNLAALPHGARVILISRVLDDYLRNEVGSKGGHDVLSKPLQDDEVARAVRFASSYWKSTEAMKQS